jgi:tetratricopeptide (TPR) repeat protein
MQKAKEFEDEKNWSDAKFVYENVLESLESLLEKAALLGAAECAFNKEMKAMVLFALGKAHYKLNQVREAKKCFKQCLTIQNTNISIHTGNAAILVTQGASGTASSHSNNNSSSVSSSDHSAATLSPIPHSSPALPSTANSTPSALRSSTSGAHLMPPAISNSQAASVTVSSTGNTTTLSTTTAVAVSTTMLPPVLCIRATIGLSKVYLKQEHFKEVWCAYE